MTVMFQGGVGGNRAVKLTTTGVTDIVSELGICMVSTLYVTEIAGGTPNLSLELYDGTTSVFLVKTKPMTANQTLEWNEIALNPGQKLRATAGTANQIDVIAILVEPGTG